MKILTSHRNMKICVLQKIVCFGVFKSLLAINLKKTLWPWITTYSVCNKSVFLGSQKKHKNCKQKSFLFLEKQKVSSVELSEKETYVSRRDCYPTFPPSQHESQTMIPQSTSYTSLPMAFKTRRKLFIQS